jgi:hypothetical protein
MRPETACRTQGPTSSEASLSELKVISKKEGNGFGSKASRGLGASISLAPSDHESSQVTANHRHQPVMKRVVQEGPLLEGDVDVDLLGVARRCRSPSGNSKGPFRRFTPHAAQRRLERVCKGSFLALTSRVVLLRCNALASDPLG